MQVLAQAATRRSRKRRGVSRIDWQQAARQVYRLGGMQGLRVVDKFQFMQGQVRTEEGVEIIAARHTVLREPFTLKKIGLRDDNKGKYMSLINEIAMLKEAASPHVIKCHKMLKTSHNLYLVYDFMATSTLQHYFPNPREAPQDQKELICARLVAALLHFKRHGIVNLNLTPANIEVIELEPSQNKQEPSLAIRINNFQYGAVLNKPIDKTIIENIPVSVYSAPEIREGVRSIGFHSDVYSLGKIFQFLEMGAGKRSSSMGLTRVKSMSERAEILEKLTNRMIQPNYKERVDIQEVKQFFEDVKMSERSSVSRGKGLQRSKTMVYMQQNSGMEESHRRESEDEPHNRSLVKSRRGEASRELSPQRPSPNFKTVCLKIVKKRNLSIFLANCSHLCLQTDLVDVDIIATVSLLFTKKSTMILSQLSKFLYTGRDQDIKMTERETQIFFKTQDYFKLQTLIAKEMSLSKKYLNEMVDKIKKSFNNLLESDEFMREISVEKIDESYFREKVLKFLRECMNNRRVETLEKETLKRMLIMGYLADFVSYDKMFEDLINEELIDLDSQTIFVRLEQLPSSKIIELLRDKIKSESLTDR